MDVYETADSFTVSVDLPGIEEKNIKVEIKNGVLKIRGEKYLNREDKNKDFYFMERTRGRFHRLVQLPVFVKEEDVQVQFKDGVLTIIIPKQEGEHHKSRYIEIKKDK